MVHSHDYFHNVNKYTGSGSQTQLSTTMAPLHPPPALLDSTGLRAALVGPTAKLGCGCPASVEVLEKVIKPDEVGTVLLFLAFLAVVVQFKREQICPGKHIVLASGFQAPTSFCWPAPENTG